MGVSMAATAEYKQQNAKARPENMKISAETVGFPASGTEQTLLSEGNKSASKTKMKSYIQLKLKRVQLTFVL